MIIIIIIIIIIIVMMMIIIIIVIIIIIIIIIIIMLTFEPQISCQKANQYKLYAHTCIAGLLFFDERNPIDNAFITSRFCMPLLDFTDGTFTIKLRLYLVQKNLKMRAFRVYHPVACKNSPLIYLK